MWPHGCSGRRRARPPARSPHASFARSGRSRSPPVPSGPSGALHTSGAWCADVCLYVGSKPGQASPPPTGTAARPRLEARPSSPDPPAPFTPVGPGRGRVPQFCTSKPGQAPPPPINVARNSPATCSNIEFASLELQCFWGVLKNDRVKLRAKFGRWWCRCCPWVSPPGPREMRPQQPAPQRKALIKGKWPPVKAVTSLDNGRKWRVYAGHTLELLR